MLVIAVGLGAGHTMHDSSVAQWFRVDEVEAHLICGPAGRDAPAHLRSSNPVAKRLRRQSLIRKRKTTKTLTLTNKSNNEKKS